MANQNHDRTKMPLLAEDGSPNSTGDELAQEEEACPQLITLEEGFQRIGYGWQQIRVLIICGLCFSTDSIEVGLLSFLQGEAKVHYDLSSNQESLLTSIVFAGELVGAILFGPLADRIGRKPSTFISAGIVAAAGLASAFSPSFAVLVSLRALVGIGIGGMAVPFDILAEFMPSESRGKALFGIEFFWTAGTIFVNGMAWAILENTSWRVLLGVCSIPPVLAMLSFPFMPESPHWLLTVGKHKEAAAVLRRAAVLNGRPDVIGPDTDVVLHRPDVSEDGMVKSVNDVEIAKQQEAHSLNPLALFGDKLIRTTVMLWIIWAGTGLTYYGTILIAPQFFNTSDNPIKFNYPALFISSTAEVIGCTIGFLLIDRVGRKSLSGWAYATCAACTAILMRGSHMSRGLGIFFLMIARGAIFIGTSTTWVVTPELYPTYVRAAGHSWCSALSRAAAFATPYWGNAKSIPLSMRLLLYALVNLVVSAASFLLPKETAGQALADD
eukprot:m.50651 g.50651  ORF g.50651 m.50651 type:complete len:496 (-) comp13445_c0_seq2:1406-2893(-)